MRLREYREDNTYTAGEVVDAIQTNGRWTDPVVVKIGNEYRSVVSVDSKIVENGSKRNVVTIIHVK